MKNYKKIYIALLAVVAIIFVGYFFVTSSIGNSNLNFIKKSFNSDQRQLIKKYLFPYTLLSEQQEIVSLVGKMGKMGLYAELYFKENEFEIETSKSTIKLSNNKILEKYKLEQGFYYGIHYNYPGSGYIDFYEDNLIIASTTGLLAFKKNLKDNKSKFKTNKNII